VSGSLHIGGRGSVISRRVLLQGRKKKGGREHRGERPRQWHDERFKRSLGELPIKLSREKKGPLGRPWWKGRHKREETVVKPQAAGVIVLNLYEERSTRINKEG